MYNNLEYIILPDLDHGCCKKYTFTGKKNVKSLFFWKKETYLFFTSPHASTHIYLEKVEIGYFELTEFELLFRQVIVQVE